MISRERFLAQDQGFRESILPAGVRTVVAECAVGFGWEAVASSTADILSLDRFGESGPGAQVAEHLGITAGRLAEIIG